MSQSFVSIRMDDQLKREFDAVCSELGMSMTTAFTIFAKKMSREKRIPFEVSVDPFYSPANQAALQESARQLQEGRVVTKTLEELEAMENG